MKKELLLRITLFWLAVVAVALPTNVLAGSEKKEMIEDVVEIEENIDEYYIYDPLEPMNRIFFQMNDALYYNLLRPVADGYSAVVAEDFRMCIANFFKNIASPIRFINALLQGRFEDSMTIVGRFALNSTVGAFGLGDPAVTEFDMAPQKADLGQTFGVWGVGDGLYLYWPIIGPSSARDTTGLGGDYFLHPLAWLDWNWETYVALRTGEFVNKTSVEPDAYTAITESALDPYVAVKSAYEGYRKNMIDNNRTESAEMIGE